MMVLATGMMALKFNSADTALRPKLLVKIQPSTSHNYTEPNMLKKSHFGITHIKKIHEQNDQYVLTKETLYKKNIEIIS